MQWLLLVTENGYAKRVGVGEIRRTKARGGVGVVVSRVPVAAALVVGEVTGDMVIATQQGMVQRVPLASIPTRRRVHQSSGRVSKGVRVMTLDDGDAVATVALARAETLPPMGVETAAEGLGGGEWPGGRVGLREGETARSAQVFGPLADLAEVKPGGSPAVERDEWARCAVHLTSTYCCVHCRTEHPSPEAVYACIDAHARAERVERERHAEAAA